MTDSPSSDRKRTTLTLKKGGNTKTQFEIENPSTVATTDNQKVKSNVKEKRGDASKG
jgi:hypothetical protein